MAMLYTEYNIVGRTRCKLQEELYITTNWNFETGGIEPSTSRESESHQQQPPQNFTAVELSVIEGDDGGPTGLQEELIQGDDDLMDEDPLCSNCVNIILL